MIILLRHAASDAEIADLRQHLGELGFESSRLDDARGRALEAHGHHVQELLALLSHPAVEDLLASETKASDEEPLWPHGALQISIIFVLIVAALLVLIAVAPAGLGDRADLGAIPPAGASEWYMRPLATFLKMFPPVLGGILVLLLWIGLVFWPFLDRKRESGPRARRIALLVRIMGALLIVVMIALALVPIP